MFCSRPFLWISQVFYTFYITRFEAGTPAIGEAVGLGAAIDYLSGIGMQKIHEYEVSFVMLWFAIHYISSVLFYFYFDSLN